MPRGTANGRVRHDHPRRHRGRRHRHAPLPRRRRDQRRPHRADRRPAIERRRRACSTRRASSSRRASSTCTRTTRRRSTGIRTARSRAGTVSRRSSWGTAGSGSRRAEPEDRERSMLSMTRNEQISLAAMQAGLPWDWTTFPEFLDSIDRIDKGVNVVSFAPLSPIMVWAMGGYATAKERRPDADEITAIQQVIDEAMDAGAMRAGRCSGSARTRSSPITTARPMITDVMTDEEGSPSRRCCARAARGRSSSRTRRSARRTSPRRSTWNPCCGGRSSSPRLRAGPCSTTSCRPSTGCPRCTAATLAWLAQCHAAWPAGLRAGGDEPQLPAVQLPHVERLRHRAGVEGGVDGHARGAPREPAQPRVARRACSPTVRG